MLRVARDIKSPDQRSLIKYKLDRATYRGIREDFPSLPLALVQTARDQASDMLKRDKFKHKIKKKPFSSIRYDRRTLSIFLESGYYIISTVSGRKRSDFVLPEYYRRYQSWRVQSAQLIVGRYACFLNVQVEDETPSLNGGDRRLGIDLGINNIAVCSDNSFFNSKHLNNVKGKSSIHIAPPRPAPDAVTSLRVSEPDAAGSEAEGREAIEAELSGKPVSLLMGS